MVNNRTDKIAQNNTNIYLLTLRVVRLPLGAVEACVRGEVLLCEVDEAGVGQDGHGDQHEQQAQLLQRL